MKKISILIILILFFAIVNFNSYDLFAQSEEAPELLNLVEIKAAIIYPELALHKDIMEDKCVVKVLVDTTGAVIEIKDVLGCDTVFHDEVRRVAWLLKFSPAIINGQLVKCWVPVPFLFRIQSKEKEDE